MSLLALAVVNGAPYGLLVPAVALGVALLVPGALPRPPLARVDRVDLAVVAVLYSAVVALFLGAFQVFTQDAVAGVFLCFAAGMLLGVAGPIYYTVWRRAVRWQTLA